MPDTILADLDALAAAAAADLMYIEDDTDGAAKQSTLTVLATFFWASPTLVTPALGTPASGVMTNVTGVAAGLTAGNVTTNANLTGHVTSVGNAAVLGSFTIAQLNTALSDWTAVGDILADGSVELSSSWDAGAFDIRSLSSHLDAGNAAGAVAQRFGADATEGYEIKVVDETVSGLSAISTDLTADVPDGAYLLSVQGNIETAVIAGGTSVKVGIGPIGDPDKYGLTGAFTKNLKIDTIPAHAILSGAEDIQVHMVTAAGAIGDTVASAGAVRVRYVFAVPNSLADAA